MLTTLFLASIVCFLRMDWRVRRAMMDLQSLRNFLTIVEQGSISNAATLIRITQPALSRQIQALEAQVGAVLLDRGRRGVALTAAGEALAFEARRVLRSVAEAQTAVDLASARRAGRIALGVSPSLARAVLPGLAALARERLPQARLSFREGPADDLCHRVAEGELDLAMIDFRTPVPRLRARHLFAERIVAIGAAGRFAPGARVTMPDLLAADTILAASSGRLRLLVEKLASRSGIAASRLVEVDSLAGLIEMVASGAGLSLAALCAVDPELVAGRLSVADVAPGPLRRTVALMRAPARHPAPAIDGMEILVDRFVRENAARFDWDLAEFAPHAGMPAADRS
jgi:LysR family transcriptional regulator, nitrogen assimilation regulatory protein